MPPKFSLQNVLDYRHSKVEKLEVILGRTATSASNSQRATGSHGTVNEIAPAGGIGFLSEWRT